MRLPVFQHNKHQFTKHTAIKTFKDFGTRRERLKWTFAPVQREGQACTPLPVQSISTFGNVLFRRRKQTFTQSEREFGVT